MRSPPQVLAEWLVSRITRPRLEYRRYVFNDPKKLKSVPLRLIPMRLREDALHFGSGKETETICSSFLAEAFAGVGLTILPLHIRRRAVRRGKLRQRCYRWAFAQRCLLPRVFLRWTASGRPTRSAYSGFLKARHPSLCVPQDFDLSPYFDVIKFNAREAIQFPYVRED